MRISDWSSDVCSSDLRAVKAENGEAVVYSWIEWPSKEARDAAWPKIMNDTSLHPDDGLFDGRRMIHGGFAPILDVRSEEHTSELQSLMRISYAVFCLKKKTK